MKIYGISGLGADERVFQKLDLAYPIIPVKWISPTPKEPLEEYAKRLLVQIDTSAPFCLLGVSFGGIVAVEITKLCSPVHTFLISSVATKNELRSIYKGFGKTNLITLLPSKAFDIPRGIASFLFGTSEKQLLSDILDDTDPTFTKWALSELTNWNNEVKINCTKIGGSKDKLLPPAQSDIIIEGGEHFMIVDRAIEISEIVNKHLHTFQGL